MSRKELSRRSFLRALGAGVGLTFAFLGSWNSFMTPLIFSSTRAKTFPLKVAELVTLHDINYTQLASTGVFASIIPVILALLFQRYIVRGLTEGAVKG